MTSSPYLGHSMSCLWARKAIHEGLKSHVAQQRCWHLLGSWPDERVAVPRGLPHRCTFVLRALNLQFAASSIEKLIGPMKLMRFSVRRGDRPCVFLLDVAIDVENASDFLLDVGIEIRF